MKKKYLFVFFILTLLIEFFITGLYIHGSFDYNTDTTKINELVNEIKLNYGDANKYPLVFDYTIIDDSNNLLYKTKDGLSESLNEAYKRKDTIVDLDINGKVNKIIISNNYEELLLKNNKSYITTIIIISALQLLILILYTIYIDINVIKPFKKMKTFASRITDGNLDIPLTMDKKNNFGAFTEAFDIMRHEIKKSRSAERKATESKKELVAKLSHDIKTPIASIKSASELGLATTKEENTRRYFESINQKSDQINTLINNLFNATLDELVELNINAVEIRSGLIKELIQNADYMSKNATFEIPNCRVFADKLRTQQVFDNIFANSYKYANTNIETKAYMEEENLVIAIRDFGNGVEAEELPLLTEKFKRGTNTENIDGSGLGLYISKELLKKMNGNLEIENANPGFIVKIYLRII